MKYDFDEIIDRSNASAYKYGGLKDSFGRDDLLPLWVADMDFATPPFILDAIRKRLEHPVLGYVKDPIDWKPSVIDWQKSHHGWEIAPESLCFINGIMKGIGLALTRLVPEGKKVIIQPPVYHMFKYTIEGAERPVVCNPLKEREDGLYDMDFENLEQIIDEDCKVLLLANPHNPGGVCWSKDTLAKLADICARHNIIVISDEIHADMTLFGNKHVPFATVSETAAQISVTFGAPSKVFNMPSVVSAWAVIPNEDLRHRFVGWLEGMELTESNIFAMPAAIAAYREGEEWRRQMLAYVEDNIRFADEYCKANLPGIKVVRPEASFLVWLDCRGLNITNDQLVDLFINKAKVAFNIGSVFGEGGEGHMRMNVATPRAILKTALDRLCNALKA